MTNDSTPAASTTSAATTTPASSSQVFNVPIVQASGAETIYPFGMPRTLFAPLDPLGRGTTSTTQPIAEPFGSTASSGSNQGSTSGQPGGLVGTLETGNVPPSGFETPEAPIPPLSQGDSLSELGGILRILTDQQRDMAAKFASLENRLQARPAANPRGSTRKNLLPDMNAAAIETDTPEDPLSPSGAITRANPENINQDTTARGMFLNVQTTPEEVQPETDDDLHGSKKLDDRSEEIPELSTRARTESRDSVIEELRQQLQAVISRVHRNESAAPEIDRVIREAQSTPFVPSITRQTLRDTSKVKIPKFEGNADPSVHLSAFHIAVMKARFLPHEREAGYCRLFAENLGGEALRWFSRLPPSSISNFGQLESAFATHYASYVKRDVSARDLWNTIQAPGETLKSYISRYRDAASRSYMPDIITIPGLQNGLRRGSKFKWDVDVNEPKTLEDALFRAQIFIRIEEAEAAAAEAEREVGLEPTPAPTRNEPRTAKKELNTSTRENRVRAYSIVEDAQEREAGASGPPTKKFRDNDHDLAAYCDFHRRNGHSTAECRHLTNQLIEEFRKGKINLPGPHARNEKRAPNPRINQVSTKNARREPTLALEDQVVPQKPEPGTAVKEEVLPQPPRARINMIMGGLLDCNDSVRAIKASERKAQAAKRLMAIARNETTPKKDIITFSDADLDGVDLPHNDPLVVSMTVADYDVARILVDTGSSINLIFKSTLDKMELEGYFVKPEFRPLTGFNGESTTTIGTISLPVGDRYGSRLVDFQIIDKPTIYNAILGTPWLFATRAVASTYHQCVKYPTIWGAATIRGNQADARVCFVHEKKLRNKNLRCSMIADETMGRPYPEPTRNRNNESYQPLITRIRGPIETLSDDFSKLRIISPRPIEKKIHSIHHTIALKRTGSARWNKDHQLVHYCRYHQLPGHSTKDCRKRRTDQHHKRLIDHYRSRRAGSSPL